MKQAYVMYEAGRSGIVLWLRNVGIAPYSNKKTGSLSGLRTADPFEYFHSVRHCWRKEKEFCFLGKLRNTTSWEKERKREAASLSALSLWGRETMQLHLHQGRSIQNQPMGKRNIPINVAAAFPSEAVAVWAAPGHETNKELSVSQQTLYHYSETTPCKSNKMQY
ncbi:uncharacterized protein J5F26_001999 isoform 2-T5 [Ciconia maguari]